MTHRCATCVPGRDLCEKRLSDAVVEAAQQFGWLVARWPTWRATGTYAGVPDLTLVRGGRLLFIELKSAKGTLSPAQENWMRELDGVKLWARGERALKPCDWPVRWAIWRPADWFSGRITEVLS